MPLDTNRRALVAAAGALALGSVAALVTAQAQERVIRIVAHKFVYQPREIRLKRGEAVVLEFTSLDVIMGFNSHDFGVRTDIIPDMVTRVRLTPGKVGEFVFYCDVFCGNGHEEMDGMLIVTE